MAPRERPLRGRLPSPRDAPFTGWGWPRAVTVADQARSLLRSSLPTLVSGMAGMIRTSRGYLVAARCALACAMSSLSLAVAPGRSAANATTSSPSRGSGRPTTPAWATSNT